MLRMILSRPAQIIVITFALVTTLAGVLGMRSAEIGSSYTKLITDESPLYPRVDKYDQLFYTQAVRDSLQQFELIHLYCTAGDHDPH
jgi:hypothetical protein